jgi:uncharacterized integral membrane protein (TIGR00697 family)
MAQIAPHSESHLPDSDAARAGGYAPPLRMDTRTTVYMWLTGVFVTCLIIADITGSKFFNFNLFDVDLSLIGVGTYHFVMHSCGMIAFPVTFLLTDLINEYYGRKGARRVTLIGLGMAGLAFVLVYAARKMPVAKESPIPQDIFDTVFGMSNRLYIASLTAYLFGQYCDIQVFHVLKRVTGGRHVWLRATGSTVVSQVIDSLMVSFILLYNAPRVDSAGAPLPPMTTGQIFEVAFTGYILKFFIAVGLTPVIYAGRWLLHEYVGLRPVDPDETT